ncbi:MAG: hypothetical protein U1G07_16760 [Verrucomicrobiota bacterium]
MRHQRFRQDRLPRLPRRWHARIFVKDGGIRTVIDTSDPAIFDFLDPVMSDTGIVAGAAFLTQGGLEVFSARHSGLQLRTDPTSSLLTFVDNVSVNNSGDVAFFANKSDGGEAILVEATGGANPTVAIETGDALFGSTVAALSMGRYGLNDEGQVAFRYSLTDGRSGIALASPSVAAAIRHARVGEIVLAVG